MNDKLLDDDNRQLHEIEGERDKSWLLDFYKHNQSSDIQEMSADDDDDDDMNMGAGDVPLNSQHIWLTINIDALFAWLVEALVVVLLCGIIGMAVALLIMNYNN